MIRNPSPQPMNERGVSALETAIILIAFVVAATLFAFTVLSSGTFLTERSKEAAHSSLRQVHGSLEVKGGLIAGASQVGASGVISQVTIIVANVAGGQPVDFNTLPGQRAVQLEYRDERQRVSIGHWSIQPRGYDDGDSLLEERELFEVIVPLDGLSPQLGPNTRFVLEIRPPVGVPLRLERVTPAVIDWVMDLH